MTSAEEPIAGRSPKLRDRRGRGMRGPGVLPRPHSAGWVPSRRSRRQDFDAIVLSVVHRLEETWHDELGLIEFAVEETPLIPDDWEAPSVPLASLVLGSGSTPTRLVLFRKPIELRCEDRAELAAMVLTVLVEQVSDLLGRPPGEIDPGYAAD